MEVTRYKIVQFKVLKPGEIIRFQYKIPAYLTQCTGFKVTHVKGMNLSFLNCEVGRVSISFNNLKEEAVTTSVTIQKAEAMEFQDLDIALKPGQLVSVVYVDSMMPDYFTQYAVNVYLRCTNKQKSIVQTQGND